MMSIVAERIKNLIKTCGLSQMDMAAKLGMNNKRLNSYLTGRSEPGYEVIIGIADIFDTSVDYLLGLTDNAAPLATSLTRGSMGGYPSGDNGEGKVFDVDLYETTNANKPFGKVRTNSIQYPTVIYALLIRDDMMYPDYYLNDVVFIEPCGHRESGRIYAVRRTKEDETGVALRQCVFKDNFLILSPANKLYLPDVLDLSATGYDPVAGKPIGIYREHEFSVK